MEIYLQYLAILGVFLSMYALYVEKKLEDDSKYKAVCDINNKMSCSKAFKSKYGKMFGISNSIYGVGFYLAVYFLSRYGYPQYVFYFAAASCVASVYLAYVLYFKVKSFCIVCTAIYLVNILLAYVSYQILY